MKLITTSLILLFCLSGYARIGETYEQCKQRYGLDYAGKLYADAASNYTNNVKKMDQKQADELVSRFKRDLERRDEYGCYQRSFTKDNIIFNITFLKDVAVKISIGKTGGLVGSMGGFKDDEINAFMLANSNNKEWSELSKEKMAEIIPMIRKAGIGDPRGNIPLYAYDKYYAIKGNSCTIVSNDLLNQVNAVESKKSQDLKKSF